MEAMQKMSAAQPVPTVRRGKNGERLDMEVDPTQLVPGDVIFLEAGNRVPADVRILACTDGMEVDNSALTGESMPEPRVTTTEKATVSPTEAHNLAFFGTTILKGKATCVVHATGDSTFLGKIAQSIKSSHVKSTLEIQIEHFVHIIAVVAIVVGLLSLAANLQAATHRDISASEILQNSAAALFAQVPEGLLPTVTISLMIASSQMVARNVLVRKIDAVETLGCVSVFCSDKTGTLTKGEMTVQDLVVPKGKNIGAEGLQIIHRADNGEMPSDDLLESIKKCGILNNGATTKEGEGGKTEYMGSPTEVAILRACAEINGGTVKAMKEMKAKPENTQLFEIPFNSENKWMATIVGSRGGGSATLILKGAPDRVLSFCSVEKDKASLNKIQSAMQDLMNDARRVLAIAKKEIPYQPNYNGTCKSDCNFPLGDMEFVGLYGIEDPPKEGVDTAVIKAKKAGVKVVMVTGDHPDTARAIAKRINILPEADPTHEGRDFVVIKGTDLEDKVPKGDNFADDEDDDLVDWWTQAVTHARVFARVSPIHKQVIVQAYQKYGYDGKGDICAMTGDGVNDAPALKQAEVGVAMGIRGTEVAKDAADIVLQDDNFSSIINGIEQGRLSSENLQKSIMYTLCSKVPQVAPTFAELLSFDGFKMPPALTVAQVLLIDIGTDIWTAIAYALQPAESKLMERPPRHPKLEKLVNWKVLVYSYGYIGQLQMACCWLMYLFAVPGMYNLVFTGAYDPKNTTAAVLQEPIVGQGMTVYYWTLVLGQIAAAISTTTKLQSVFGFFGTPYCLPNMTLNAMFVGEILLGLAAIYWTPMQAWFDTMPLSKESLYKPIAALVFICFVEEVRKLVGRSMEPDDEEDEEYSGSEDEDHEQASGSSDYESSQGTARPLLC
eukprot:TRINITY_DN3948_c0_g5_i1.p2 TRINITY_DN3948_c0_g5~~TRINITY_DN3948_c0_g5_i1.p2  ORF type:complete len:895 (-),score=259.19 TRINITY_DN3948_c0_g5_i1:160-2844(-)